MAEQNLLVKAGRVRCEGAQLLYELVRLNGNHFLKFYNVLGQLKLIRPIPIPPHADEIHPAGPSLLLHLSPPSPSTPPHLLLLQFAHLLPTSTPIACDIPAPLDGRPRIHHLYSNEDLDLIVFSDWQNRIFLLRLNEPLPTCRPLHHCDAPVKRLQLMNDQHSDTLVAVLERGDSLLLEMDWDHNKLVRVRRDDNLVDYYQDLHEDSAFTVEVTRRRKGEEESDQEVQHERELYLSINNRKYECCFSEPPNLLFFSGRNYLLIFNRTDPALISVYNQIFRVTKLEEVCSEEDELLLLKHVENSNTMVRFRADSNENVRLEIRLMKGGKWTQMVLPLPISAENKEINSHSFLKKNLHNLLLQNGLPPPHWILRIDHSLKQLQKSEHSFQQQPLTMPQLSTDLLLNLNLQDLGFKLLRAGLKYFPKQICKLGRRLKQNMLAGASTSLEGHRFLAYCNKILDEFVFQLKELARKIEHDDSRQESEQNLKEKLKDILNSLERMIDFLTTLSPPQTYFSLTNTKHIADKAKRIYLCARLLDHDAICDKLRKWQNDIKESAEQDQEIFRTYSKLTEMNYLPKMVHQHFNDKPFPVDVNLEYSIVDLLDRKEFLEVAYIYESITRVPSTPYLPTDVSDLLENLAFHLPRLLPSEDIKNSKSHDLLHKVAATTLRVDYGPFLRYVAQLAVVHHEHALAVLLLQRPAASSDPKFCVDTLLLAGQPALAHIHVLEHYSSELFEHFLKSASHTGSLGLISQLRVEKLLHPDAEQIMRNQPTEPVFREILESLNLAPAFD